MEPTDLQVRFVVNAGAECERNAASLTTESALRLQGHFPARACALAVAALEEHGKANMLLRMTTEFDPAFLDSLRRRSHPTKQHEEKQVEALRSVARVHGLQGFAAIVGGIDAAVEASRDINVRREAALYVDADESAISSPLDTISPEVAAQYVALAENQRRGVAWLFRATVRY